MPFGYFFGAIFFAVVACWLGAGLLQSGGPTERIAGVATVVVGLSLAAGLFKRKPWARWSGVAWGFALTVVGGFLVDRRGTTADFVIVFGAVVVVLLLLISGAGGTVRADGPRRPGPLVWTTIGGSLVVLVAVGLGLGSSESTTQVAARPAVKLSHVPWTDFASGLEVARAEGKPMLVNFVAGWCGYCRKMDRETWKNPAVIEQLGPVVTVRVDIDDTREIGGVAGTNLAGRYAIQGVPATLLIDDDGRVLSRTGGYQTSRQLLDWLGQSLNQGFSTTRNH